MLCSILIFENGIFIIILWYNILLIFVLYLYNFFEVFLKFVNMINECIVSLLVMRFWLFEYLGWYLMLEGDMILGYI